VLPLQQPFGHEAASHTHCPPAQVWPAAHATHARPLEPHEVVVSAASASHPPMLVQQPAQDPPPQEHEPLVHVSPEPQAAHAAPPVPQTPDDCPVNGTHVLPLQHPLGHEAASHAHCPLALHACPVAQAPQAAPAVPHEDVDSDPNGSHVPVEPPLQQPLGHVVASHAQVPLPVSHTPFAQTLHAAPLAPHCEADCDE
jgi:hypothetical protein